MRGVNMDAVRWTKGFWAEKFDLCRATMVPNMWRLLSDTQFSHAYNNFLVAAGLVEGRHRGPKWNDGDFYKWLEAAAYVCGLTRDKDLDALIDEVAELLGKVQRPNGYIHTPVIVAEKSDGAADRAFGERMDFETYNLGHLMTTGCVHYRATGKTNLLDPARKAADFLVDYFKTARADLARNAVCPSHYMGAVEMYRTTGEERYRELARNLIEIRDLFKDGGDDNQDRIPLREQTEAVGHAVRANYLYAGVADVYMETGDATLLDTLNALWKSVVFEKMYVTGACGALFDGASPYGVKDQASITRTHQAYGRQYELPNVTSHNETCANIGNAIWNWRMLQITGEGRFADVMELVFYNSLLCGIGLDGKSFFYTNPMRVLKDQPYPLRWSRRRQPYIGCFCCPPNAVRTIAEMNSYAYSVSEDAVWVHLYGSNALETDLPDGGKIALEQETDYPWDGRVRIVVRSAPSPDFALMLRIPGWAQGASIRVNGQATDAEIKPGDYCVLKRRWAAGDAVELDLPMPVRFLEANPLVEETLNQVAVQRGPIVYCLESADLPEGVGVLEVRVSPDTVFTPRMDSELLAGERVVVLEGKAQRIPQGEWGGTLYRDVRTPESETIDIRLVPYYAWGNRSEGEMTVWMPKR
ncbi:glycoside hydrolase family 127 protein [Candidatus Sumerlaeota bacterium]|nr:glycoside hydrolase family 127 protein [Candidatus Sumerlaeota bacterium]